MSNEHRYSEDEIAAIFEQAAEEQEKTRSTARDGLTLNELQQIGADAGISPDLVARVAARLKKGSLKPTTSGILGFPITVEHTVDLPGTLSDQQWEELVADARSTFRASGTVSGDGSFREWRNGNLHIHVESLNNRNQLSFRTQKGSATETIASGGILLAMGLVLVLTVLLKNGFLLEPELFLVGMFAVGGLGMLGYAKSTLPKWAKMRSEQMEEIAERTLERMSSNTIEAHQVDMPKLDLNTLPDIDEATGSINTQKIRA